MADEATVQEWADWLGRVDGFASAVRALIEGELADPGDLPSPPAGPVPAEMMVEVEVRRAQMTALMVEGESARLAMRTRLDRALAYGEPVERRDMGTL